MMEADGVRWFVELLPGLTDRARSALAGFVNCPADDVVFVPNATTGVTTALENLGPQLRSGDEIIATSHEYPSCMNNMRRVCARSGARVVPVAISLPVESPDAIAAAILGAVTPRTRVALISHITSPSALILPVERLVHELESRGIITIIDGAHAIGFTPLDIERLAPSFYTANCHKWLCTPKGAAFLYIRPDRQRGFRPLVLSNHAERPVTGRRHLHTEFDYIGTDDFTARLCIPEAIGFLGSLLPGGWAGNLEVNHELAARARLMLCERLGVAPPAPESMIGCMATIWLPPHDPQRHARLMARPTAYHDALQDALHTKHCIQVPIWAVPGETARFIRISAQLYNAWEEYEHLAGALMEELEIERRL
jgi:isopenicillin-N epimerase